MSDAATDGQLPAFIARINATSAVETASQSEAMRSRLLACAFTSLTRTAIAALTGAIIALYLDAASVTLHADGEVATVGDVDTAVAAEVDPGPFDPQAASEAANATAPPMR